MAFGSVVAGVAVRDIEAAKTWYERFFDRAADRHPMPNDVEWDFANGSSLQLFADAERAGKSSITLGPDDFDTEIARLERLGHHPVDTGSGTFRFAIFADPDGNQIVVAALA